MPNFTPRPGDQSAFFVVLPKGDYEFIIGEPKPFAGKNQKGAENHGVRYMLTVADGEMANKKISISLYQHSDGAIAFSKRFLVAGLGFQNNGEGEKQFNAEFANEDWSYDTDTGRAGGAWVMLKGKRIRGSLGIQADDKGNDQQTFDSWMPFQG